MRAPLSLVLATVACGTCPDAPAFIDTTGDHADLLDTLEATYTTWRSQVGEDRACIGEVRIAELHEKEAWVPTIRGPASVYVDPDASWPEGKLRWGLCTELAWQTGLLDDPDSPFGTDELGQAEFGWRCQGGPPHDGLSAQLVAACGEDVLDDADRFLVDHVYVHGDSDAPALDAAWLDEVRVPDFFTHGTHVSDYVVVGDKLGVMVRMAGRRQFRVDLLDPLTGSRETLVRGQREWGSSLYLHGGDALVVHTYRYDEPDTLWVYEPGTATTTEVQVRLDDSVLHGAVRGRELFWMSGWWDDSARAYLVGLDDGAVRSVDLPAPDHPLSVIPSSAVHPTADAGFLLELSDVSIEAEYDYAIITTHRDAVWTYAPEVDRWTEIHSGTWGNLLGETAAGLQPIVLYGPYPNLLGAWDPDLGALRVSDGVCLDGEAPQVMWGDTPIALAEDGADLVLRPLALAPAGAR